MPHLNDLSINTILEGNNGEKWIVTGGTDSPDELLRIIKRLKVEEKIEPTLD